MHHLELWFLTMPRQTQSLGRMGFGEFVMSLPGDALGIPPNIYGKIIAKDWCGTMGFSLLAL